MSHGHGDEFIFYTPKLYEYIFDMNIYSKPAARDYRKYIYIYIYMYIYVCVIYEINLYGRYL